MGNSSTLSIECNKQVDVTVAELVARYMSEHVEHHYRRPDETLSSEVRDFALSARPLVRLFGRKPAREFTPLDLRAYRDALVQASWMTAEEVAKLRKRRGHDGTCSRRTANQRTGRIKRLFKWACQMMLVTPMVWHALQAVSGLQPGRGKAREPKEVAPVPLADVEKTLNYLPEIFADIVRIQLYSGARAGDVLKMRTADIDQDAAPDVWTFEPATHKNAWRGHKRRLVLGPRAQLILRRYLRPNAPEAFLFKPGTIRKSKRPHRQRYDVVEFDKAIGRAAMKAGVPHWSSHQLRHLAARLAEREISLEASRAFLGHRSPELTVHCSGIDLQAAADVARRIG